MPLPSVRPILGLALAAALLAGCNGSDDPPQTVGSAGTVLSPPANAAPVEIATPVTIGGPFSVVSDDGAAVTEAVLVGRPSILFFGFTHCPDVCPTALADATAWLRTLGDAAADLQVFFVTVDPERDTVEAMNAYLTAFDPRIVGLTGPVEAVHAMLNAFRVVYVKAPLDGGGYTMNHTASFYLMDRAGQFDGVIQYTDTSDEAVAKLRALIAG